MEGDTPIVMDSPARMFDAVVHDDPMCPACLGTKLVCASHPDKAWLEGSCCGAGAAPCPTITEARTRLALAL
jgi:hypothetical protein